MIAPAPRKPMPVTICAAIRDGSARTTLAPDARNSWNPYAETIVNSAEPSETSRCVRSPASRSRSSRSSPIAAPSAAASASRSRTSHQSSVGRLRTERVLLGVADPGDPGLREVEHRVEPGAAEDGPLGRRLHLDELFVVGHDDVHVDLRPRILRVVEVQEDLALDDRDRDRRAPRAAVRLEDIAVDPQRALAERLEVRHRPESPPDQPLDLDRAPALPAARGLALGPLPRRGRQER